MWVGRTTIAFVTTIAFATTIAFVTTVSLGGGAQAQPEANPSFGDMARRLGLQLDMPHIQPPEQTRFQISDDALRVILWGAVILGIAIIVWSLRDSLPVFSRSRTIAAPQENAANDLAREMTYAQLEADDLAAQGQYNEAMHMLLHKSLQELHRRLGQRFAASLTSREILRRAQLADGGRTALTEIIKSVEMTYFGGREANQADYVVCRDHFAVFRDTLGATVSA